MRPASPHWQCSCTIAGKQRRTTTKEESLARAKDVARDWYLGLMGKYRAGELKEGVTFRRASEFFVNEYEAITLGERNKDYVASHAMRLRVHLLPFFGDKVVTDVTPGLVQEYRVHRMTSRSRQEDRPAQATLSANAPSGDGHPSPCPEDSQSPWLAALPAGHLGTL